MSTQKEEEVFEGGAEPLGLLFTDNMGSLAKLSTLLGLFPAYPACN